MGAGCTHGACGVQTLASFAPHLPCPKYGQRRKFLTHSIATRLCSIQVPLLTDAALVKAHVFQDRLVPVISSCSGYSSSLVQLRAG